MSESGKKIGLCWNKDQDTQFRKRLKRISSPEVGDTMADGTIYAGISPYTHKPMFAAPRDIEMDDAYHQVDSCAKNLDVGGKKDFRIPSIDELEVLFQNRNKGNLKGTFNESALYYSSDYHYSNSDADACLDFSDGTTDYYIELKQASLRCIR